MTMNKLTKLFIILLLFAFSQAQANEKIFVVERNDSALSVIENHKHKSRITNLHNFNHAVVKFHKNEGFMITRDGYVIKFDPVTEEKLKEYKTSKSAIGFVIEDRYLAVANYDNKTVEILDHDLKSIQSFTTDSKNVGIKIYKDYLVFALMDKDEVWVLKDQAPSAKTPNFKLQKNFKNIGTAPFDAMINDQFYIVGFFNSPHVGVIDLEKMSFSKLELALGNKQPVLKVPHFGFWSISADRIFIPAVGDNKVFVFDSKFNFVKAIDVAGLPVFTSLSPDKKQLAVTFSGEHFPVVEIIDTKSLKITQHFDFNGKVLHLRWSKLEPLIYISNNSDSKVLAYNTQDWTRQFEVPVKKPSGIFIYSNAADH